ncbi:MAG TPA: lipopolysaccharide transport periplasmic protein LptA [Nitrospirota bacterium]
MSKRCFRNSLFLVASFLFLVAADKGARPDKGPHGPILITSIHMEADKLGDKVTFTGNVTLKKDTMTLTTDSMIVYYDEKSKDIKEIESHGNVVIRQEGRIAHSNDAWYYSNDEKIILTGDANVVENDNVVGGEKITLFLRDDRSIVEGGKVLLYQDKTDKPLDSRTRK